MQNYDYGLCDICGSSMKETLIKQDFWIKEELIVLENVPAGVCIHCGEKIVNAEVGKIIIKLIKDKDLISSAPRISVPHLNFNKFPAIL